MLEINSAPGIAAQAQYWAEWNKAYRESDINPLSEREAHIVLLWIEDLKRTDLHILDVGCGSGWTCERMVRFGSVIGLDLSEEMLARARERVPQTRFIASDILGCDLPANSFDVIVTLEVLSHVSDLARFFKRCSELLRPGGLLLLCTQNRSIYSRMAEIAAPSPNQIRKWVDARELRALASDDFKIFELTSIEPRGYGGFLRYVNSVKVNAILSRVFGKRGVQRLKERLMLGCTLVMKAKRK